MCDPTSAPPRRPPSRTARAARPPHGSTPVVLRGSPANERRSPRPTVRDEPTPPWMIPPIVQELAADVQEPPSRYVVREQDRPAAAAFDAIPEPIPIIDLSRLSTAATMRSPSSGPPCRTGSYSWLLVTG
ncbi:unnamed protein product [Urochloa humidicola]